jgi:hypothetical protein
MDRIGGSHRRRVGVGSGSRRLALPETSAASRKPGYSRAGVPAVSWRAESAVRSATLALREDLVRQGKGELADLGLEVGGRHEPHAVAAGRLAESRWRGGGARRLDEGDDRGVLGSEAGGVDLDLAPRRDRPHRRMPELEPLIIGVVKRMQPTTAARPGRRVGIVSAGEAAGAVDRGLPRRRGRERQGKENTARTQLPSPVAGHGGGEVWDATHAGVRSRSGFRGWGIRRGRVVGWRGSSLGRRAGSGRRTGSTRIRRDGPGRSSERGSRNRRRPSSWVPGRLLVPAITRRVSAASSRPRAASDPSDKR